MADRVPRLRMFAGPNGSGKSTLKAHLRPDLLGHYLNADEIELALRSPEGFDFSPFGLVPSPEELHAFWRASSLLRRTDLVRAAERLVLYRNRLGFGDVEGNSYFAAVVADFVRRRLLASRASFSFETVMSSRDKVLLLREAQGRGYRTYLYFMATDDPEINVSRVQNRVRLGGHDVPHDKIVERYARCLGLLPEAIAYSNRAYVFDNSGENVERTWIAEFTDGLEMELQTARIPRWFERAVLDQIVF